jgi:YHS domain-containing protein
MCIAKEQTLNISAKDPVCHFAVHHALLTSEFEGIPYVFCSAQCQERFLANPHLYVGLLGHKALGQKGGALIKKHRFLLTPVLRLTT